MNFKGSCSIPAHRVLSIYFARMSWVWFRWLHRRIRWCLEVQIQACVCLSWILCVLHLRPILLISFAFWGHASHHVGILILFITLLHYELDLSLNIIEALMNSSKSFVCNLLTFMAQVCKVHIAAGRWHGVRIRLRVQSVVKDLLIRMSLHTVLQGTLYAEWIYMASVWGAITIQWLYHRHILALIGMSISTSFL